MTVDELRKYFKVKTDKALSEKLSISRSAISKWRNKGIPSTRQAMFEIQTKRKLKADISHIEERKNEN